MYLLDYFQQEFITPNLKDSFGAEKISKHKFSASVYSNRENLSLKKKGASMRPFQTLK